MNNRQSSEYLLNLFHVLTNYSRGAGDTPVPAARTDNNDNAQAACFEALLFRITSDSETYALGAALFTF